MFVSEKANGEPPISPSKQALLTAYAKLSIPGAWVQHTPRTDHQDCLETAIARALGWSHTNPRWNIPREFTIAYRATMRAIKNYHERELEKRMQEYPHVILPALPRDFRVATWNDLLGRKLEEVLWVLQEAVNLVDEVEAEFAAHPAGLETPWQECPLVGLGATALPPTALFTVKPGTFKVVDIKEMHAVLVDTCWNG